METNTDASASTKLAPVPSNKRIEALDVVRGFALIGICMMNVEYFNRSLHEIGTGMPAGLTGIHWFASFFVAYFVAGKFWTIFSLLFGMGFAVMLTRAETAGRGFLAPYIRRIAALAVIGTLHHIFIWGGDILFSYSVGAVALLIILYGKWKWIVLAIAAFAGLAFVPGFSEAGGVAAALALSSLYALFMRNEKIVKIRGFSRPIVSFLFLVVGIVAVIAAVALWVIPGAPKDPKVPVTIASGMFLLLSHLSNKYHNPVSERSWRTGVTAYAFPFLMGIGITGVMYFSPPEPKPLPGAAVAASTDTKKAETKVASAAPAAPTVAEKRTDPKSATSKDTKKAPLTEAEEKAEAEKKRAERLKERAETIKTEIKVMSSGSYTEAVVLRAKNWAERAPDEAGFGTLLAGMFLLGSWFVRSGVMANTAAHLPMFRKIAMFGLPFGIGLGLLGASIATTHVAGVRDDGWGLASTLLMLGNLPASLGYVSLVIVMLHSASNWARIRVLAPFGRMALTNYLMQSVIGTLVFYGYGLGNWGMERAWQLVYVVPVIVLQVAFSHWWLARFRYGPAEWVWRAVTYWTIPSMRIEAGPTPVASAA